MKRKFKAGDVVTLSKIFMNMYSENGRYHMTLRVTKNIDNDYFMGTVIKIGGFSRRIGTEVKEVTDLFELVNKISKYEI